MANRSGFSQGAVQAGRSWSPRLIAAIIGLGLLKPWGNGAGCVAGRSIRSRPRRRAADGQLSTATPDAAGLPSAFAQPVSPDPHDDTSGPCYYGRAWRLFTAEPSDVGIVRTWYGLAPVEADGPTDSRIKAVVIHSNTIDQLGYCSVPESAQGAVVATSVWRLAPGAPPVAIAPEPIGPAGSANPLERGDLSPAGHDPELTGGRPGAVGPETELDPGRVCLRRPAGRRDQERVVRGRDRPAAAGPA